MMFVMAVARVLEATLGFVCDHQETIFYVRQIRR